MDLRAVPVTVFQFSLVLGSRFLLSVRKQSRPSPVFPCFFFSQLITWCHWISYLAPFCSVTFSQDTYFIFDFFFFPDAKNRKWVHKTVFDLLQKAPEDLRLSHLHQNSVAMFFLRSLLQNLLEDKLQHFHLLLKILKIVKVDIPIMKKLNAILRWSYNVFHKIQIKSSNWFAVILFWNLFIQWFWPNISFPQKICKPAELIRPMWFEYRRAYFANSYFAIVSQLLLCK